MKKTYLLFSFSFILFLFPLMTNGIENPFPVNSAGITAYAKINASGIEIVTEALTFLDSVDDTDTTYALGKKIVPITVKAEGVDVREKNISVSFYIDTNGWIASFLERDEDTSKIMQWTDYKEKGVQDNILEEVLSSMIESLEVNLETEINYYHFGYPEANRIVMIVETMDHIVEKSDSFSITVPGIIHEASYSLFYSLLNGNYDEWSCAPTLRIDEKEVFSLFVQKCVGSDLVYGRYNLDHIKANVPHLIKLSADTEGSYNISLGASTVIIYQV